VLTDLEELRKQLLSKIDTDDLLEVNKVHRYIKMNELDRKCDEAIEKDGTTIVTENGAQRFAKSNPAVSDKIKTNNQIIAIEKTFNFISEGIPSSPASSTVEEQYTDDDLI
jgi:hypothetical protein